MIGTTIFVLVLGGMVSRSITGPVRKLTDATKKVAKGNLPTRIDLGTKDEIGALAASFDQMTKNLQTSQAKLNEAQADLVRQERLTVKGQLSATVMVPERHTGKP